MKKVLLISIPLLLIISAISLPLIFAFGKTGSNTQILNKDYSLLSKKEITSRLDVDFPLPENITLTTGQRQFVLKLASISARLDTDQIASNLLFRRFNQGIDKYFQAFFQPKKFPLEIKYRSENLEQYLADLSTQIDQPFIPTELNMDTKTKEINVKNGQIGQKVDTASLRQQIINALQYYDSQFSLSIPLTSVGSLPSSSEIDHVKQVATSLVGKNIELVVSDQSVFIDDQVLISWLGFDSPCRQDRLQEYVDNLKKSLKKDPVDAVFKFENNKVLDFQAASNGYSISDPDLSRKICTALTNLTDNSDKSSKLEVAVAIVEPKIKTADANDLGIKELLGRGVSTFKHSSAIRNFNVAKGASIINRLLVPPGETFSFVKNLGEVSLATGYKNAYIIRQGKTELDAGGGICQVSTTFFRAMLNAGLDITARQSHAYRVSYYEEDMPPGYDATVFVPSPDLKFVNDTGHYVLIQNTYDGVNKKLTYEIYGTSDGRQVDISNYRQWDSTPAPPDVYIDDPTLPVGKIVQDEHRIPGLKTSFDWKVTRQGEIIHQKTFQSSYVPWAAVYRRGTKTD